MSIWSNKSIASVLASFKIPVSDSRKINIISLELMSVGTIPPPPLNNYLSVLVDYETLIRSAAPNPRQVQIMTNILTIMKRKISDKYWTPGESSMQDVDISLGDVLQAYKTISLYTLEKIPATKVTLHDLRSPFINIKVTPLYPTPFDGSLRTYCDAWDVKPGKDGSVPSQPAFCSIASAVPRINENLVYYVTEETAALGGLFILLLILIIISIILAVVVAKKLRTRSKYGNRKQQVK